MTSKKKKKEPTKKSTTKKTTTKSSSTTKKTTTKKKTSELENSIFGDDTIFKSSTNNDTYNCVSYSYTHYPSISNKI
jgi:hypothetical protein